MTYYLSLIKQKQDLEKQLRKLLKQGGETAKIKDLEKRLKTLQNHMQQYSRQD